MKDLLCMETTATRLAAAGREINRRRFESRGNCVLNGEQAIAIRAEYGLGGCSYRSLGDKYSVDYTTIRRIIKRTSWDHL